MARPRLLAVLGPPDLDAEVQDLGALAEAAAAAIGRPDLLGKEPLVVAARVAAVHVAAGEGSARIAALLGVDARSVRRLAASAADARIVAAIKAQLALRAVVVADPSLASPRAEAPPWFDSRIQRPGAARVDRVGQP